MRLALSTLIALALLGGSADARSWDTRSMNIAYRNLPVPCARADMHVLPASRAPIGTVVSPGAAGFYLSGCTVYIVDTWENRRFKPRCSNILHEFAHAALTAVGVPSTLQHSMIWGGANPIYTFDERGWRGTNPLCNSETA